MGFTYYASDTDDHLYIMNPNTGAVLNTITTDYTLYALASTEGVVVPLPPPCCCWAPVCWHCGMEEA